MKEVRILSLVTDAFGGYGGIAVYNRDFLEALAAYPRCSEVVTVPRLMAEDPGALPPKVTHVTSALGGKWRYFAAVLSTLARYKRFELIVCAHIHLLPFGYLAQVVTGAPLVLIMYGIDVWQPPRSRFTRWALREVRAYVSISKVTEQRFLGWARGCSAKSHILPNAIHLEAYGPGEKDPALAERYGVSGRHVLMTFGRLVEAERYKGFDEVIDVLPDLLREVPDLIYLVAGKGPDTERLKVKAQTLGVASNVVFTGYVAEKEKSALYRLADVYAMPSRGEGFGFVILEALATGIPTIASSVDGGREAVRDGLLGQLVNPANPDELKAAILRALHLPKVVPDGLSYFAYPNFKRRLHGMVDEWLGHSRAQAPN